ncbi:MAG: ATP-binding protein, partial [Bacilli bacterium]
LYSPDAESLKEIPKSFFLENESLQLSYNEGKTIYLKENIPGVKIDSELSDDYILVGIPYKKPNGESGAIYGYQSLVVVNKTVAQTMEYIFISAAIGIILTTIFAFFLSTRITSPLRKMRQVTFEISRGKFDSQVPILSTDEIGELSIAINGMAKQLKFNIDALRKEKEQLSGILSSMSDGVAVLTRDSQFFVLNVPAERFVQSWYYERGMRQSMDRELPEEVYELFNQVLLLESEQSVEVNFQGRHWNIVMSPLYDGQSIRGAVIILRDQTYEFQLEKLRKDFVANVSHELRTPIAMLQGYSEAIVDGFAQSDEEVKELAGIIHEESLRMGRLVKDLLDLASMEAGYLQLNYTPIYVNDFFDRSVMKFHALAKEKNIDLSVSFGTNVSSFVFDADRIEQVVTNLISNAIRHTQEGGSIVVSVYQREDELEFAVTDTGTGIATEDIPYVFDRFYKADKARTRSKSGTGLGLSIARNIVVTHGGKIEVFSAIGKGTSFIVLIPRKEV